MSHNIPKALRTPDVISAAVYPCNTAPDDMDSVARDKLRRWGFETCMGAADMTWREYRGTREVGTEQPMIAFACRAEILGRWAAKQAAQS